MNKNKQNLDNKKVKSYKELIAEYQEQKANYVQGEILTMQGISNKDVYNITAPVENKGQLYLLGRVESRDSEEDSQSCFFIYRKETNVWQLSSDLFSWPMQDPDLTSIGGKYILSGVVVTPSPSVKGQLDYQEIFFQGTNFKNFIKFTEGPKGMKDIHLIELPALAKENKKFPKIGIFTRPQGGICGRGKIGFITINSLEDLRPEVILKAKIIENQFKESEWGGVNGVYLLKDGRLGVLGHIAFEENNSKHYAALTFIFNLNTFKITAMKIIATRNDFPNGPAKKPELKDVIFPGGLVKIIDSDKVELYCGVSDTQAGKIIIKNPFGDLW